MKCKPGDLAYITHPSMLGKLVTVLSAAPVGEFRFPNGTLSAAKVWRHGDWVIQSMGGPFDVVRCSGRPATNIYAVCNDCWLRPIRGDGLPESETTDADLRQPVAA